MKRALIVGAAPVAGEEAFYRRILADARYVVAADAAGEWCAGLGRVPDVTVGDFDSSLDGAQERLVALGSGIVEFPGVKDRSDLDEAVAEARARGAESIVFTAAFTCRFDHTLAAFGCVARAKDLRPRVSEPGWEAWLLDSSARPALCVIVDAGTTFSVISLFGAEGVSIGGGEYALENAPLEPLSSLGLSNVATESELRFTVGKGSILVIAATRRD